MPKLARCLRSIISWTCLQQQQHGKACNALQHREDGTSM
jgi:hypothetical protein